MVSGSRTIDVTVDASTASDIEMFKGFLIILKVMWVFYWMPITKCLLCCRYTPKVVINQWHADISSISTLIRHTVHTFYMIRAYIIDYIVFVENDLWVLLCIFHSVNEMFYDKYDN